MRPPLRPVAPPPGGPVRDAAGGGERPAHVPAHAHAASHHGPGASSPASRSRRTTRWSRSCRRSIQATALVALRAGRGATLRQRRAGAERRWRSTRVAIGAGHRAAARVPPAPTRAAAAGRRPHRRLLAHGDGDRRRGHRRAAGSGRHVPGRQAQHGAGRGPGVRRRWPPLLELRIRRRGASSTRTCRPTARRSRR